MSAESWPERLHVLLRLPTPLPIAQICPVPGSFLNISNAGTSCVFFLCWSWIFTHQLLSLSFLQAKAGCFVFQQRGLIHVRDLFCVAFYLQIYQGA